MSEFVNMDHLQSSYQNGGGVREADFQRLSQSVGATIQKILQNVTSMERMIAQIGTPQDNHQLRTQLTHIQHETGLLAKDSAKLLKDYNAVKPRGAAASTLEQRQQRLQYGRLQDDFTRALNSFQTAQTKAAQREKDVIKKARSNVGLQGPGKQGNLIDMDDNTGGEGASGAPAYGQSKTQMLLEEEEKMEELQDREMSIRQLESDIIDVNTIFKDLATMVHEQGEVVDSIEGNVADASIRVEEGTQQLRQAEHYKNKARKKKVILALVGVVILSIIIGIIAWQAQG